MSKYPHQPPQKEHHVPILLDEILNELDIQENDTILDGTIGLGGHSQAMHQQLGKTGHLVGYDQDPNAIAFCQSRFSSYPNVTLINDNVSHVHPSTSKHTPKKFSKILLDLGYSSYQLDHQNIGLSFLQDGPLDMRLNRNTEQNSASDILQSYSEQDLSDLFFNFGELYQNKRLVNAIINERQKTPIPHTSQLISLIKKSYFFHQNRRKMLKIFAQVFQALRIATNDELGHLERFLAQLSDITEEKAVVAIISFHSLEDRMIKQFGKRKEGPFKARYKKVITPTQNEIEQNSRATSAKLRILDKK